MRRGLVVGKVHTATVLDHSPAGFVVEVSVEDPQAATTATRSSAAHAGPPADGEAEEGEPGTCTAQTPSPTGAC